MKRFPALTLKLTGGPGNGTLTLVHLHMDNYKKRKKAGAPMGISIMSSPQFVPLA